MASGRRATGVVAAPPSKSATQRYLALALLADEGLAIERPLDALDTRLFAAALERCGRRVEWGEESLEIGPPDRSAAAGGAAGGDLDCGNGGTMLRFLTAALTVVPGEWRLDGVPRLHQRPVGPLVQALRELGADVRYLGRDGHPPLRVVGGELAGGEVELDAGESSQYLSALLLAAQRARGEVVVRTRALTSAPYVDLTLETIAELGGAATRRGEGVFAAWPSRLRGGTVRVEGDWSAACYAAAAAALTGGAVRLEGVRPDSRQGDRRFVDLLLEMGARVEVAGGAVTVAGGSGGLRGIEVDLADLPDQVPTLAALAPFAAGTTTIRNVPHLRLKESDRLRVMGRELRRLGAAVEERPDGLVVEGVWASAPPPAEPVTVDPHGDHRIAMSLALVGLRRPGVSVADPGVVAKSYPGFWRDLERLTSR